MYKPILICIAFIINGCGYTSNPDNHSQVSTTDRSALFAHPWRLSAITPTSLTRIDNAILNSFTLVITPKRISGTARNSFFADAAFSDNGQITISPAMGVTRMMVPGREGELEHLYLDILANSTSWNIHDYRLVLSGPSTQLIFIKNN